MDNGAACPIAFAMARWLANSIRGPSEADRDTRRGQPFGWLCFTMPAADHRNLLSIQAQTPPFPGEVRA